MAFEADCSLSTVLEALCVASTTGFPVPVKCRLASESPVGVALKDRTRPRGAGAKRRRSDRAAVGPMTAFLRLERGGTDLVIVPIEKREDNVVIGPAPARLPRM
jgi:hypothetical protein